LFRRGKEATGQNGRLKNGDSYESTTHNKRKGRERKKRGAILSKSRVHNTSNLLT